MKVIVFGATGMIGQGVLRECLLADDVESVLAVGRSGTAQTHPKLRELIHRDFTDFSTVANDLAGYDACFWCLGISSVGMKEPDYTRVTYDYTMAAASQLNPESTFVYVSGAGTDGKAMWARVKGRAEKAVLDRFANGYAFRPGFVQPLHGIRSKTRLYQFFLTAGRPLWPLLRRIAPKLVVSTEQIGTAMLVVARRGAPKRILESRDIALIEQVR